jgi:hypothetical protein
MQLKTSQALFLTSSYQRPENAYFIYETFMVN